MQEFKLQLSQKAIELNVYKRIQTTLNAYKCTQIILNYFSTMTIGERIRSKRKELGMSQSELSKKLKVSNVAISRWESGDIINIRPENLVPLSEILSVDIKWLVTGEEETHTKEIEVPARTKRIIHLFEKLSKNQQDEVIKNLEKLKYFNQIEEELEYLRLKLKDEYTPVTPQNLQNG